MFITISICTTNITLCAKAPRELLLILQRLSYKVFLEGLLCSRHWKPNESDFELRHGIVFLIESHNLKSERDLGNDFVFCLISLMKK